MAKNTAKNVTTMNAAIGNIADRIQRMSESELRAKIEKANMIAEEKSRVTKAGQEYESVIRAVFNLTGESAYKVETLGIIVASLKQDAENEIAESEGREAKIISEKNTIQAVRSYLRNKAGKQHFEITAGKPQMVSLKN